MIRVIILIIGVVSILPACAQTDSSDKGIEQMNWLVGKWQRQTNRPNRSAFEEWHKTPTGELAGVGVTLQGTDTVFVERLQIIEKESKLYYVAEVAHNAAPTYFEIIEIGKHRFISANPNHDFPKKISYTLAEDGILNATISGDGKQMTMVFQRVAASN